MRSTSASLSSPAATPAVAAADAVTDPVAAATAASVATSAASAVPSAVPAAMARPVVDAVDREAVLRVLVVPVVVLPGAAPPSTPRTRRRSPAWALRCLPLAVFYAAFFPMLRLASFFSRLLLYNEEGLLGEGGLCSERVCLEASKLVYSSRQKFLKMRGDTNG